MVKEITYQNKNYEADILESEGSYHIKIKGFGAYRNISLETLNDVDKFSIFVKKIIDNQKPKVLSDWDGNIKS